MLPEQALLHKVLVVIVEPALGLLFMVAFVYFLYGVFTYMKHGADPKKHKEGAKAILFGVIGLAIMFGVSGIVNFVANTLRVQSPNDANYKPAVVFPTDISIQNK